MARLIQLSVWLAALSTVSVLVSSAEENSDEDTFVSSSNDGEAQRYRRTPFLTLPGLTWGWPARVPERPRIYEVGKKNIPIHRRFGFGIGKRTYDWRPYYDDDYDSSSSEEVVKRKDNRYSFGLGKRFDAHKFYRQHRPYDIGLGKREVSQSDLQDVQREEDEAVQRSKRSLDDNDDDDIMEQRLQRGMYSFGLGKRRNFNFGLGKRLYDEDDDGELVYPLDKRGKSYSFGLGKRGNGNNKPYSFGLGKRGEEDDEEDAIEDIKRAKQYGFGLGKRDRANKGYNFGLGKRGKNYSFGLGKREDTEENVDKRGKGNNHQYSFGLGKRTVEAGADDAAHLDSNGGDALSSSHIDSSHLV